LLKSLYPTTHTQRAHICERFLAPLLSLSSSLSCCKLAFQSFYLVILLIVPLMSSCMARLPVVPPVCIVGMRVIGIPCLNVSSVCCAPFPHGVCLPPVCIVGLPVVPPCKVKLPVVPPLYMAVMLVVHQCVWQCCLFFPRAPTVKAGNVVTVG
jgi:hypothetical protein